MNKKRIDEFLPKAVEAIKTQEIADKNGAVSNTYRAYISQFGAAVAMGSLLSAIATLNQQRGAQEDRGKLVKAMEQVLDLEEGNSLFNYAKDNSNVRDKILDCALAIKLALNFYVVKKDEKTAETEGGSEH